jgi:hypothetical protein
MDYNLTKRTTNNLSTIAIHQSNDYDESWVLEISNKLYEFLINSRNESPPKSVYENQKIVFLKFNNIIFLFSKDNGTLLFLSKLFDDFTDIKPVYNGYLIMTDITLLLISNFDYSILKILFFPDIITGLKITDEKITVQMIDEPDYELIL